MIFDLMEDVLSTMWPYCPCISICVCYIKNKKRERNQYRGLNMHLTASNLRFHSVRASHDC